MKLSDIRLDKKSSIPLYRQLGDEIFKLIKSGVLCPNDKLPPIRKVSDVLGVNNVTVVNAYKYLENKKIVYSQVGSGTFVSPLPLDTVPEPVAEQNIHFNANFTEEERQFPGMINLSDTSIPQSLFPVDEFKTAFNTLLDLEKGEAFSTTEIQGHVPLRELLCEYLAKYGINTKIENIQILSGAQQGIDIVTKAMASYGDIVFTEKPTFYGAAGAFLSHGCQIIEIPMLENGVDVSALENMAKLYHPKFFYTMAYFQTPTGISVNLEKKRHVLELSEKYNFYIIEDDNLYDFNYGKSSIVPYKALDYHDRVIYIKSFSKILMPGLRIGFSVLPQTISKSIAEAKYTSDISTSGFIQKALEIYLSGNTWQKHIENVRKYANEQYRFAVKYADRNLRETCRYIKPNGGISLWVDTGLDDINRLINMLREKNVMISNGSQFMINGEKTSCVRLCFCNLSQNKLEAGIRRMGECIKMLKN
ncbi:MAG: PLP-dependent aminotransferase family protein [Clostridia bacterium]|jgi:DNA-binding transcriptional MocR family regulator|nr:PLP-dependent aminotransferase family protein [Clostridia bacterium]MCI2015971.1 PLP-dependent aminotransferase family protein [Clostridia bacterium]